MTQSILADDIVEDLRYLKRNGAITKEIWQEFFVFMMPKFLPQIIGLLSASYLVFSIASFWRGDISSGIASLGPMFSSAYILYHLKQKLSG